ncbi:MAG: glycosyltransferase family 2 protein [Hyphomicrobium sp.]|uniref:glycosyltransferase n=1 Tax=Hyphomicrobium sp. TaxID=82 RepID=UPI0039E44ECB
MELQSVSPVEREKEPTSVSAHFPLVDDIKDRRIAVCVCTCMRPQLLTACLASLARLNIPAGYFPIVVVIDNDVDQSAKRVVEGFSDFPLPLKYVVEPRRGIAIARNRALRAAQEFDVGWMAFIDDDETAHPDWLVGLMHEDYLDTPILMGWQIIEPPHPTPFWYIEDADKDPEEGQRCTSAYTNNVRFRMSVPEAGLAFDEQLALSGGEDLQFFFSAHCKGFAIQRTRRAITYEALHVERTGYFRQCYRTVWIAAANFRKDVSKFGNIYAIARRVHTIPIHLIGGLALVVVSPVAFVAGPQWFKRTALLGGRKIGRGVGRLMAIFGYVPQPYAKIDGA